MEGTPEFQQAAATVSKVAVMTAREKAAAKQLQALRKRIKSMRDSLEEFALQNEIQQIPADEEGRGSYMSMDIVAKHPKPGMQEVGALYMHKHGPDAWRSFQMELYGSMASSTEFQFKLHVPKGAFPEKNSN